jgi:hypothetical protein
VLAIISALVITVSLCRWAYLDAVAHGAAHRWRLAAAIPVLGVIVWLRFGRPHLDRGSKTH